MPKAVARGSHVRGRAGLTVSLAGRPTPPFDRSFGPSNVVKHRPSCRCLVRDDVKLRLNRPSSSPSALRSAGPAIPSPPARPCAHRLRTLPQQMSLVPQRNNSTAGVVPLRGTTPAKTPLKCGRCPSFKDDTRTSTRTDAISYGVYLLDFRRLCSTHSSWQFSATVLPPSTQGVM